jgi:hypothetical protein
MYMPTQNLAQQTFVTTPVIPLVLVSNAVSQPENYLANWNHQPFPFESTTALHPTQVSFPFHANRLGLVNQLFFVYENFVGPPMLISHVYRVNIFNLNSIIVNHPNLIVCLETSSTHSWFS